MNFVLRVGTRSDPVSDKEVLDKVNEALKKVSGNFVTGWGSDGASLLAER